MPCSGRFAAGGNRGGGLGSSFRVLPPSAPRKARPLLSRVCEITKGSPEPIDKGTLSRFEHGQQTPSIFRLGPLGRIYEISADALLERMELDREVDRLGGPATAGKSYDELHRAGGDALVTGKRKWDAYAYFRDAVPLAGADRKVAAWINLVTSIRHLGRTPWRSTSSASSKTTVPLDARQRALVHERMSCCCRCLGDMKRAESYADSAIAEALEAWRFAHPGLRVLGASGRRDRPRTVGGRRRLHS